MGTWRLVLLWLTTVAVAGPMAGATLANKAGDIAAGQDMFVHGCVSCHDDTAYGVNSDGPELFGVVGRRVGAVTGYSYSTALQIANHNQDTWTTGRLDRFLKGPALMYPGTTMPWSYSARKDRHAMIAYLKSLKLKQ